MQKKVVDGELGIGVLVKKFGGVEGEGEVVERVGSGLVMELVAEVVDELLGEVEGMRLVLVVGIGEDKFLASGEARKLLEQGKGVWGSSRGGWWGFCGNNLAAGENGGQEVVGVVGNQENLGKLRWFSESLEEGMLGLAGKIVGIKKDGSLVIAGGRFGGEKTLKSANGIDANRLVGIGVEQELGSGNGQINQ